MQFAAIDFETANEKWNSACAIGVAVAENGRVTRSESFLIRPRELRFNSFNSSLHGITEADVVDAPTLAEAWPLVDEMIAGELVVAHNAKFDFGVIRHAFHANGMEFPQINYLCSLAIARSVWPHAASHSLGMLAPWLGIELEHHQAESDARASAEIVLKACSEAGVHSPTRLAEQLALQVGAIFPDGDWTPCSTGLTSRQVKEWIELDLPEDFDFESHPLNNKSIVITGALPYCSRDNAHAIIEQLGGKPKSAVSKKTDFLVAGVQDMSKFSKGHDASGKMRKALELRSNGIEIEIVSPEHLYELMFSRSN